MRRFLHLVSFVVVCLSAGNATAQVQSFTPVSLLPADAPMDEYTVTGDGNRVYYTSTKGEVFLYDRKTLKTTRISEGGDIWDITVSKNGSAVAYTRGENGGKDEYVWTIPLDPATGLAKGPQRRVSMMPGDAPGISHDGRQVAFARDDSSGQSLVVVPTLGGPEHVLARFPVAIYGIKWAPDGTSLVYFLNPNRLNPREKSSIQRISIGGGSSKLVVETPSGLPGLSLEGTLIALRDSSSRRAFLLVDSTGRRAGSFTPPVGFTPSHWTTGSIVASRNRNPFREHIYDLATGTTRVVADSIEDTAYPLWSPDGKRFSFVAHGSYDELVVMNRDESSGHSMKLERRFGHGGGGWSPDGRWILYTAAGLPWTLVAVEPATGRQVALATSERDILSQWTEDSRAVLIVVARHDGTTQNLSLREVDLTGGSKELLQVPAGPGAYLVPVDRKSAFVRRGDDRPLLLESLASGKSLQILPAGSGFISGPILSKSGQWVAFRRNAQGNSNVFHTIDVAKMDGSSHISIDVPFVISRGAAAFLPGDKQIVVSESAPADAKPGKYIGGVYLLTPDTRDIKKLFTFTSFSGRSAEVSLSRDGKSILYTSRDSLPPAFATLDISRFLKRKQ